MTFGEFLMWLVPVISAVIIGALLGWLAVSRAMNYWLYVRSWTRLEVVVKDTDTYVSGHKYCAKCSEPLQVYARSVGFDTTNGKERFRKIGRCDRWRWYHPGGHARRAGFTASPTERSWMSFSPGPDYES